MAIYSLHVQSLGRSSGKSATAAAAYRGSIQIEDERTGEVHDYTRKHGNEHSQILLPSNCSEPNMIPSKLWNMAEVAEKRKNSVVAREIRLALPAELDSEQRRKLAQIFAQEISDRHQVGVQLDIHQPNRAGDQRNHHVHLLMTTRVMEPDGSLGAKTRELDVKKTSSQHVEHWRERWADLQNEALAFAGVAQTVDHRSHTRRGLKTEPTIHLGAAATAMERRDQETDRGNINREIQEYNAEIQALAALQEVRSGLETQLDEAKAEQQRQADMEIFGNIGGAEPNLESELEAPEESVDENFIAGLEQSSQAWAHQPEVDSLQDELSEILQQKLELKREEQLRREIEIPDALGQEQEEERERDRSKDFVLEM